MYAVVNIYGKQFKVTEADKLYVPYFESEPGAKVEFSDVLMCADDAGVRVGTPLLAGSRVTATVLEHIKDEKVIVFKKKKRKGFKRFRGHRQDLTRVEINTIEL
jgi:large subunit ribosomal protein L21